MAIHKVRSPIMCRVGQFEPGKQSLAIGIDWHALTSTDVYSFILGKCRYDIDVVKTIELVEKYQSKYINKSGKLVAMLPVKDFNRYDLATGVEIKPEVDLGWTQKQAQTFGEKYPDWNTNRPIINGKKMTIADAELEFKVTK